MMATVNPYDFAFDDNSTDENDPWANWQPWQAATPTAPTAPTAPTTNYSTGTTANFTNNNIDPATGRAISYPGPWGVQGNYGPVGSWGVPVMYTNETGSGNLRRDVTNNLNRVSSLRNLGTIGAPTTASTTPTGTSSAGNYTTGSAQAFGSGTQGGTTAPSGPPATGPDGNPWPVNPETNLPISGPGWMEGVDFVTIDDPSTGQPTQFPLPIQNTLTPNNIEYWLQDDQTLKGLQTYFNAMQAYMQSQQNAYQWNSEFNQANQRYWYEQPWQMGLEQYNAELAGRQQYMDELLARDASGQWSQEFQRSVANDTFAQDLANRQLQFQMSQSDRELTIQERQQIWNETYQQGLLDAREKDREAELLAARYNTFGRAAAPARWVASWA